MNILYGREHEQTKIQLYLLLYTIHMAAKDTYHEIVVEALEKINWDVTDDPLYFSTGDVTF